MFNSKKLRGFVFLVVVGMLMACLSLTGYVQAKPITLTFSTYTPPSYEVVHGVNLSFVKYVNEHGEGKVKMKYYHSGTLLGGNEQLTGLAAGTADIVWCGYGAPLVTFYSLPFLFPDRDSFNEAGTPGNEIYETLSRELEQKYGYKLLGGVSSCDYQIYTRNKQITKPEDLKGLVIRTITKESGQWLEAVGAGVEFMPSSELYLALQRGVLDGTLHYPSGIIGRSGQDVLSYTVNSPNIYYTPIFLLMMADRFNNLPEDVQKILLKAGRQYVEDISRGVLLEDKEVSIPKLREAGMVFNEWSPEIVMECAKTAGPIWKEWAESNGDTGNRLIEMAFEVAK